jgi:hypothetical protein
MTMWMAKEMEMEDYLGVKASPKRLRLLQREETV